MPEATKVVLLNADNTAVSATHPLPVVVESGGGTEDVNIAQVAGATVATGHGTAAGTLRVELPTDGTGVVGLNAGTAIIGNVRIDQTTPGTTNGVVVNSGTVTATGTPITSIVSASAEASHVLKAGAGTLYTVYAVNLTSTPGYLIVLNATSAPGDGAVTPIDAAPLPAFGTAFILYDSSQGHTYSTGITAVLTSAATVFTKTTGVITGFINGAVA